MVSYGFDGFAFDGDVVFRNRSGKVVRRISGDGCVVAGNEPVVARNRAPGRNFLPASPLAMSMPIVTMQPPRFRRRYLI